MSKILAETTQVGGRTYLVVDITDNDILAYLWGLANTAEADVKESAKDCIKIGANGSIQMPLFFSIEEECRARDLRLR